MDVATMRRAFPGLSAARAAEFNSGLNTALRLAGCTTVKRAAMFCAQVGEESISLTAPTELASGAEYEGRADLGNTHPGDGVRFKGRGFIQITGRFNYGELSRWAHAKGLVPSATYFIDHPRQLATDKYVWLGPIWYWTVARPMNHLADAGNIEDATRAINGGLNGIADRTNRWHLCLKLGNAILPTPAATAILEDSMLLNKGQGRDHPDRAARRHQVGPVLLRPGRAARGRHPRRPSSDQAGPQQRQRTRGDRTQRHPRIRRPSP